MLEDVRRQNIAYVMGTVGKQSRNGSAAGVRVVDPISLDRETPCFIEGSLVVGRVAAGHLHGLDEEGTRIVRAIEQGGPMFGQVGIDIGVQPAEIRENQAKRFSRKEVGSGVLEGR